MSKLITPAVLATLVIVSGLVTARTAKARSVPPSIVCHATLPLSPGAKGRSAKLTYRLTGSVALPTAEGPQTPIGRSLYLTVQQHEGEQIKTLLKRSLVKDYAEIAPDADYSKLPFTGGFRAKPNDPQRLYAVRASAYGLYISLRPIQGQPDQMQIVHYLSPGKLVRSQAKCSTTMAAKLAPIQNQLNTKNWAAADRETRRIFDPQSVDIRSQEISQPTPEMIHAIDQAWLEASDGRFGLSVQLWAWKRAQAAKPQDQEAAVNLLRDRLGWKLTKPRSTTDFISSDWLNESELNYALKAPIGHLPWVGVSDQAVIDVATPEPGENCGSCTIDAMALRSTRFYGYIPNYFARIEAALKQQ